METLVLENRRRTVSVRVDDGTIPFPPSKIAAVNVASVPQRSPLRYPGGKTWLIPHIRAWFATMGSPSPLLVEPFAGGGIVSLTAVMERLVQQAIMIERDPDVAAFWQAALHHGPELAARVQRFNPERAEIERLLSGEPEDTIDRGFRTLVMNRTRRGGVLAPGASLVKHGENGNGVASRWYPETLRKRLIDIRLSASRIEFREGDGVQLMEELAVAHPDACFFIDPPYTAKGGKNAGSRLYAHNVVDHARVFRTMAETRANFLMTYDYSDEVVSLIRAHDFHAVKVLMKNGHHARVPELVITRDRLFA